MEEDVGPSEASGLLSMLQRYQGVMAIVAAVAAIGVGLYFARHTVPGSTINAKLFNLYALAEKVRAAVLSPLCCSEVLGRMSAVVSGHLHACPHGCLADLHTPSTVSPVIHPHYTTLHITLNRTYCDRVSSS